MRIFLHAPMAMAVILIAASSALSGCYITPVMPPQGTVYTDISAPLDLDLNETSLGTKEGTAQTESILGIVAWGDASTEAAAANGGISKINHADYEFFHVFGIYQRFSVKVYGD